MAMTNHEVSNRRPTKGWMRWALASLAGLALLVALIFLPVRSYVEFLLEWTRSIGYWGYVVVILFYIAACVLLIPGSLVTLAAGFLFGLAAGTIVVSIGSTLGAAAAFLVGRYLARGMIERKVAESPRFSAIDEAVGRQGFKIVLLTRLSPVFPFTLLNYAFGLTRVRFGSYVLASWVGMMPGTLMYVYFGSTAKDLAQVFSGNVEGGMAQHFMKFAGLAATVLVTVYITQVARQALKKEIPKSTMESQAP